MNRAKRVTFREEYSLAHESDSRRIKQSDDTLPKPFIQWKAIIIIKALNRNTILLP